MNRFVTSLLGAFTGTWIAFFVIGIFIFFSGIAILSSVTLSSVTTSVEDNSILCIDLSGEITDRPHNKSLQEMLNDDGQDNNLHDILSAIENAATNDKIKGIYLNCGDMQTGIATAGAIRDALIDFKKESGKWIYAYGHGISQSDYYVASVADSIFLNPVGALDIHGLSSGTLYFKGLLDKLGVEIQIVKVGTFKSAVEPFSRTSMSDENRLQTNVYLSNIWSQMCKDITRSRRNVSVAAINEFADSLLTYQDAEIAKAKGFVDGLCYEHQFESKLRRLVGADETDDLNIVTPYEVVNSDIPDNSSDNQIAVIYAEGDIAVSGEEQGINSAELVPQIIELADDENVKGLVMRVNSPGGSAYASEQIWEALEYFKSKKKPVAVSMGDYAASGGYYISCGADRIFAEPTTITGSIGIFGMIPSLKGMMNDKLGITADFVTTSPNANISVFEPLTPVQLNAFQQTINNGYELFVSRCAKGRKTTADKIKSIAEGRVWDGISAKNIGLVDQFGGIDDAVDYVAKKAKLGDDYDTVFYPQYTEDFFNLLYNSLQSSLAASQAPFGNEQLADHIKKVQSILNKDRLQCRMEYIYIR